MNRRKVYLFLIAFFLLSGCISNKYTFIESENFDTRVSYLIIHFTSQNTQESIRTLTENSLFPVSSHYLITDTGKVIQMVNENERAWHAGRSYWQGFTAINDLSIGIEIVNQSGCKKEIEEISSIGSLNKYCTFESFSEDQIQNLIKLIEDILERHPRIRPFGILAHSDIAPTRKLDPGPLFPWEELAIIGIGAWYDNDDYLLYYDKFNENMPQLEFLQERLRDFGYKIDITGLNDKQSIAAVRAFQLHFRPKNYDGYFDAETSAILFSLLKKYDL